MSKALVTGGMGFVGGEIVRQLCARGNKVCILDRVQSSDNSVESIKVDITDTKALKQALRERCFDVIYHVASFPGDTGNAREMMGLNVLGLMNMLDWAREHPVKRFVITGSICSYGWYPATQFTTPKYLPVDEEYPVGSKDIKDMYCTTKRIQELLAISYYNLYQVPSTVLRLTTVVGPAGKGGGRAWRDFAEKIKESKKVQIPYFTPEEKFHFVDIRDVARAHIVAAEHPKAIDEIFNIAAKEPTVGTDFIEIVEKIVPGIKVECGFPWSMAQGGQLWFDTSKAKDLLGFEAQYNLEDSIRAIKDWVDAGGLKEGKGGDMDNKYGAGAEKF